MKTILTQDEIVAAWRGVNFADMNAVTYARAIEAAIVEKIGEAVAKVDKSDDGQWADILPDRSVKVNQPLYAIPFIKKVE